MSIKKIFSTISFLFLFTSISALGKPASHPIGSYGIDPMHSKIGFEIPHLVISTVEGRFKDVSGSIDMAETLAKSKVSVVIDAASIDTGVGKRDDHLRSADFFDSSRFSKITFISHEIKGTPEDFQVIGDLTIKGVTKKVSLQSAFRGAVGDGYGNEKVVFTGKTKINRKEFGLTWNNLVEAGPVVGDEVVIDITLQAARPAKK